MNGDTEVWREFWADNADESSSGCLPNRRASIEEAQRAVWREFIKGVPQGSRLLDLATGDARVLGWINDDRPDLRLIGVDVAPELPPAPEGAETLTDVPMEDLPFGGDKFAAVVSQFGFEYGDVDAAVEEISRVLAPGGIVGLMVHRGDGPILEHNLKRREAIAWVIEEKRVPQVVSAALTAPNGGIQAAAQVGAALAVLGANRYGEKSPAWEICEAIRLAVAMGQQDGAQSIVEAIATIEAKAGNELGRICSLESACQTADDREGVVAAFGAHGLEPQATTVVTEPSGRAFADFISFE